MDGYNFKNFMDCKGVTLKTLKGSFNSFIISKFVYTAVSVISIIVEKQILLCVN